jgi:type IV secretion system protein VirB9
MTLSGLFYLAACLVILGGVYPASSQETSGHAVQDPRIRTLLYDPNRVVRLDAAYGYQMMLQLGADERIENVAIGEGSTWQVTPNKEANLIFLKPMAHAVRTNMTVVTDRRQYLFELNARPDAAGEPLAYVVRFTYPPPPVVLAPPPPPKPGPPERRNTNYAYAGPRDLAPSLVFDDGRFTYFQWPATAATPAVFVVGTDGRESLADYSHRDGFQVIEQLAPEFRLRNGKKVTTIVNEGWRAPDPGAEAPRPLDAKAARALAHQKGAS